MIKTSSIIIDDITQYSNFSPDGLTFNFTHRVASQDAVLAIYINHANAATPTVYYNNQQLTIYKSATPGANDKLDLYYITNPPVGQGDFKVICPLNTGFLGFLAVSVLGVKKSNPNPQTFSATGAASVASLTITLPPLLAGSLVLDCYGASYTAFPVTFQATQEWQREIVNESAPSATTQAAINASYSEGSASSRNIGWNSAVGSATVSAAAYIALVLEPANPVSLWYPSIDERTLGDTSSHNTDVGPGSPLIFNEGYRPATFFRNSFLHTVGRIVGPDVNPPSGGQKLESLTENFAQWPNQDKWKAAGSVIDATKTNFTNNQLQITTLASAANYYDILSTLTYDFTSSYAMVEVIDRGNQALAGLEMVLYIQKVGDSSNKVYFTMNSGNLEPRKVVGGVSSSVSGAAIAYDTIKHRWLRIRESGGTVFYETSPDSLSWTTLTTLANFFDPRLAQAGLEAGDFNATEAATTVIFANFNTPKYRTLTTQLSNITNDDFVRTQNWKQSFLHTVGRIFPSAQNGPYGILSSANTKSKIVIDNIVESSASSCSINISSSDAVVVIFAKAVVVSNNIKFNGMTLTSLQTTSFTLGSTTNLDTYYIVNPPVGTISITNANSSTITAISLLGVNKKKLSPLLFANTGTGTLGTLPIYPSAANSFVLDHFSSVDQGGSNSTAISNSNQATIHNSTTRSQFVSYAIVGPGENTLTWATTTASPTWGYQAIALEPAQAPSMAFPNINLRNANDIIQVNALDVTGNLGAAYVKNYGNFSSVFWQNSFLHTVGRIIPPTPADAANPAGILFQTSQIVIDRITQTAITNGTDTSVDHFVSSQDAVMVIFASQMGITQGINSVTLNGQALTNLSPNSVSTLAGGIFYSVNPNVGINTIAANITLAAAMELIVITLLGVDKKTAIPLTISNNGVASSPSSSLTPSSTNSLLLDFVGTLAGAGSPDTSQIQYFEQPQSGSAAFGSIKLAGASPQTMSWTTAGAAWAQFIIALEPANAPSLWYPVIDQRTLLDVIGPNAMDVSINPSGNFYQTNGNYASTFWENSFLHTIGRMRPFTPSGSLSSTLLMMGVG